MTGLAIGVNSMKSGERALLHVGWELAYGKEGSFSFPNVPPTADVLYEVELIGFDETGEVSYLFLSQFLVCTSEGAGTHNFLWNMFRGKHEVT